MKALAQVLCALCVAIATCAPAAAQRTPPWQPLNEESLALFRQGKYDQSTEAARKGLAMVERLQGADHQGASVFLNRIAENYRLQARFSEAEPLYERTLKIIETKLGPDHPRMAIVLTNQAIMRVNQSRHREAEAQLDRALAIHERSGGDAAQFALTLNGLARIYTARGEPDRAV
jgi:tetratricopeptide (TPR) repeat protein